MYQRIVAVCYCFHLCCCHSCCCCCLLWLLLPLLFFFLYSEINISLVAYHSSAENCKCSRRALFLSLPLSVHSLQLMYESLAYMAHIRRQLEDSSAGVRAFNEYLLCSSTWWVCPICSCPAYGSGIYAADMWRVCMRRANNTATTQIAIARTRKWSEQHFPTQIGHIGESFTVMHTPHTHTADQNQWIYSHSGNACPLQI